MASTAVGSNLNHGAVQVATTATQIVPGRTVRKSVTIVNAGAAAIYVGGSSVTTGTGLEIGADGSLKLEDFNGPLFGVAVALQVAPDDTRFLEVF